MRFPLHPRTHNSQQKLMQNLSCQDFADRVQKERAFFDRILQKYPFLAAREDMPIRATRSAYLCLALGLDPKSLYAWTGKWAEALRRAEELSNEEERECHDAVETLTRFVDLCEEIEPQKVHGEDTLPHFA
jgi:hypothetical protein